MFVTVTGRGPHPRYPIYPYFLHIPSHFSYIAILPTMSNPRCIIDSQPRLLSKSMEDLSIEAIDKLLQAQWCGLARFSLWEIQLFDCSNGDISSPCDFRRGSWAFLGLRFGCVCVCVLGDVFGVGDILRFVGIPCEYINISMYFFYIWYILMLTLAWTSTGMAYIYNTRSICSTKLALLKTRRDWRLVEICHVCDI